MSNCQLKQLLQDRSLGKHHVCAPPTGSYDIILTPDAQDEILESSEQGKETTVALIVDARMDLSHSGDVTITATQGSSSVRGPYPVSSLEKQVKVRQPSLWFGDS